MPPTDIYTLALHDALPISGDGPGRHVGRGDTVIELTDDAVVGPGHVAQHGHRRPHAGVAVVAYTRLQRSEEHTSELQSRGHLVCRLLLEKKKIEYVYL